MIEIIPEDTTGRHNLRMKYETPNLPATISFGYLLLSFAWIGCSDRLLDLFPLEPGSSLWLQTIKGWGFVAASALLLYRILRPWQAQRDHARLALIESESRLRQMADNVHEVFWLTDTEKHTMLFVSSAYERIWGRSCQSLYDQPGTWMDSIIPEDREIVKASLRLQPTGEYDTTYRIQTKEGEQRWIHDRAFPVRDGRGQVFRVAGVARDITAQVHGDQKRAELEQQLRHSQKMEALGLLAGGVAHDFNNLLTVVMGGASLIEPSKPGEQEYLREIVHAAERGASLTRQLLTFCRKQVMQLAVVDVNEVMQNITGILRRLVGEQISITTRFLPQLPNIYADAGMLEQVLVNLVVNSRDAMLNGGHLCISTSEVFRTVNSRGQIIDTTPGRYICLEVRDSGCGIEPATLPHIFDPFFTTKEVGKGTGLGLPTVYGILEQHRGGLEVESQTGQGTVVRALFPVVETVEQQQAPEPVTAPIHGLGKVLLAEDDPALQKLVQRILQNCGYRVVTAATGPDALQIWSAQRKTFDYLVTDLVMPGGMSGRELGEQLLKEEPGLKILYTSGYSQELTGCAETLALGDHFLAKPYTPAQLAQALRNCAQK